MPLQSAVVDVQGGAHGEIISNVHLEGSNLTFNYVGAAAANAVLFPASASDMDNFYNGCTVTIISGTGIGQTRTVNDYNLSPKVAFLDSNWTVTPAVDSVFVVTGPVKMHTKNPASGLIVPLEIGKSDTHTNMQGKLFAPEYKSGGAGANPSVDSTDMILVVKTDGSVKSETAGTLVGYHSSYYQLNNHNLLAYNTVSNIIQKLNDPVAKYPGQIISAWARTGQPSLLLNAVWNNHTFPGVTSSNTYFSDDVNRGMPATFDLCSTHGVNIADYNDAALTAGCSYFTAPYDAWYEFEFVIQLYGQSAAVGDAMVCVNSLTDSVNFPGELKYNLPYPPIVTAYTMTQNERYVVRATGRLPLYNGTKIAPGISFTNGSSAVIDAFSNTANYFNVRYLGTWA